MDSSPEASILPAVAIVGLSIELPSRMHSHVNLDFPAFERILFSGKDVYEKFPSERLNVKAWQGSNLGQILTDTGAFLKNLAFFDYLEFGVSMKVARAMAVGSRKLLEQSFLALLDSGIDYRGRNVGCFMSSVDFDISNIVEPDVFEAKGSFAGTPCMIANRISYHLDLLGPSVPIDTACSSSLTATHLAVQALRQGDCEAAIVGGCQVNHRLIDWINYSQGSILSPEGKSKPFDANANGFGRGEGVVVVVLKLLKDAIRDGDHIYASILGTGINSNGSAAPVSAPVAESQMDAMFRAYSRTGCSPTEVDFIEMHATGTFCIIPPSVNFLKPNPAIKWDEYKLHVVKEKCIVRPCHPSGRALISIASSGIGGSNGHAVLEGVHLCNEGNQPPPVFQHRPILLMAGGLTPHSVSAISESLIDFLSEQDASHLPMLSVILGRRARQMTWHSFAIARPREAVTAGHFSAPVLTPRRKPPVVFVFSGQGPQHVQMGRQLFEEHSVFRETILYLDLIYEKRVGRSLIKTTGLFDSSATFADLPSIWPISIVLPAITMIQIALVDLLHSVNVIPDIVIGHSAGETAVLYASGAGSKEMAISVAIARGKAMTIVENVGGAMAALSCSPDVAKSIIDPIVDREGGGTLEIACFNAPNAVTIAGSENYVTDIIVETKRQGYFATPLHTRVPVHCCMMDACAKQYRASMDEVFEAHPGCHRPTIKTFSMLTGSQLEAPFTPIYFWENTRNSVKFAEAVSVLLRETPDATFVEISLHSVLSNYLVELGAKTSSIFCPMRRTKNPQNHHESIAFLGCLGKLMSRGLAKVDVSAINGIRSIDSAEVSLPPYPFLRRYVQYYPDQSVLITRQLAVRNGAMDGSHVRINSKTHPVLAEHLIKGEPIMPASGYLEMIFERGAKQVWNVEFRSMFSLSSAYPVLMNVRLDGLHWSVLSVPDLSNQAVTRLHAEGFFSTAFREANSDYERLKLSSIMERCSKIEINGRGEVLTQVRGKSLDLEKIMTGNVDDAEYYLPSRIDNLQLHKSLFNLGLPETLFVHFQRGNEMHLKQLLSEVSKHEQKTLWIFATGNLDSAAAKGFSRSLRREVPLWDIRLVLLPREWAISTQYAAIQSLMTSGISEAEVSITADGEVLLPRVALSSAPTPRQFDASSFWYLDDKNKILHAASPTVPHGHVVVFIEAMSPPEMSLRGIIGRVQKNSCLESRVIGIVKDQPLSNFAIAHEKHIMSIKDSKTVGPELALSALVAYMAFGLATWTQCSGVRRGSILVTSSYTTAGRGLRCILTVLGIPHDSTEDIPLSFPEVSTCYELVLSGSTQKEEIQVLGHLSRTSPPFLWNDPTYGLQSTLNRQPWIAADALSILNRLPDFVSESGTTPLQELTSSVDLSSAQVSWHLFDSHKAYLLIGGIGSLGVAIAVWMYKSSSLRKNENTLRMLKFLQTQVDVSIRMESCDATCKDDTVKLLSTIGVPIGSCMLLSVLLSDMTFFAHTNETYEAPFYPKVKAFRVLEHAMDIEKLDFFVAFSSCIIFGNAGQTNYSRQVFCCVGSITSPNTNAFGSANTVLGELTGRYRNAFSFVVPAIHDSTVALEYSEFRLASLLPWAMTSETLCNYLEDAILKLTDGPIGHYIPDFDWNVVCDCLGPSSLYGHLRRKDDVQTKEHLERAPTSLKDIVLAHIDINAEDLSPDVPLTSYGLDSLSATRLSFEIRSLIPISGLQLLADMTLNDLEVKLLDSSNQRTDLPSRNGRDFDWSQLNRSGETVVRLRDLDENPLILIHGTSGNVVAFKPLQERFSTALWAIQVTPETPSQSIYAIARFYFDQIKKE
nr:SHPKS2 polyketide synthase 2 [Sanghuangporus sanghuang]